MQYFKNEYCWQIRNYMRLWDWIVLSVSCYLNGFVKSTKGTLKSEWLMIRWAAPIAWIIPYSQCFNLKYNINCLRRGFICAFNEKIFVISGRAYRYYWLYSLIVILFQEQLWISTLVCQNLFWLWFVWKKCPFGSRTSKKLFLW